jgi:hypothetical protein
MRAYAARQPTPLPGVAASAHPYVKLARAIDDALVFTLLARDYEASAARRTAFTAFDGAGRKLA